MTIFTANRTVLQAVGKLILEETAPEALAPFNTPSTKAGMNACITVLKDNSPFVDRPDRGLMNNRGKWKATWEDLFVVTDEVLREDP